MSCPHFVDLNDATGLADVLSLSQRAKGLSGIRQQPKRCDPRAPPQISSPSPALKSALQMAFAIYIRIGGGRAHRQP